MTTSTSPSFWSGRIRGRRFWPFRDYPRLRETARAIERRLGLTETAASDGTAGRSASRGEIEKAARQGRDPARAELARAVREAALASSGAEAFIEGLRTAGYLAELRLAPSGDPIGFKIARPGNLSTTGQPVFYSGSKLAPDLSMRQAAAAPDPQHRRIRHRLFGHGRVAGRTGPPGSGRGPPWRRCRGHRRGTRPAMC